MTTDSSKPEDILWQFSEELIQGQSPRISDYQNYFKKQRKQNELMKELIALKIAFLIAHPELNIKEDPESLDNLINMLKSSSPKRRWIFDNKRRTYGTNK